MKTEIVLSASQQHVLQKALFGPSPAEGAAFLMAGVSRTAAGFRLTTHEVRALGVEDLVGSDEAHLRLKPAAILEAVNRAQELGCALVEAHSHPLSRLGRFSYVDERGLREVVPYMLGSLKSGVYCATVWGKEGMEGRVWEKGSERHHLVNRVRVSGTLETQAWMTAEDEPKEAEANGDLRTDRLDRAIGLAGRRRISRTTFAIVGLGGLGANLLVALLSIGARRFILIDPDVLKEENVDRIPYANWDDAKRGLLKVALASRYATSRAPDAVVREIPGSIGSPQALEALKEADVIIGAVDTYYARLVITNFASAYLMPYLDCGTGVHTKASVVTDMGGRISILLPGERCMQCTGRINSRELNYELSVESEREVSRRRGYVTGLDVPQPMVGSLNGTVANLAVTEILTMVASLKKPADQLYYDALTGCVSEVAFTPKGECRVCDGISGLADYSDVLERFGPQTSKKRLEKG